MELSRHKNQRGTIAPKTLTTTILKAVFQVTGRPWWFNTAHGNAVTPSAPTSMNIDG